MKGDKGKGNVYRKSQRELVCACLWGSGTAVLGDAADLVLLFEDRTHIPCGQQQSCLPDQDRKCFSHACPRLRGGPDDLGPPGLGISGATFQKKKC